MLFLRNLFSFLTLIAALGVLEFPTALRADPTEKEITSALDIDIQEPTTTSTGLKIRNFVFKVKGLFSSGLKNDLPNPQSASSEEAKKQQAFMAIAKHMKRPQVEIETAVYEIQNDAQLLEARIRILAENKRAMREQSTLPGVREWAKTVFGKDQRLDYDPMRPLGLDVEKLDEAKLTAYMKTTNNRQILRLALSRYIVNGSVTAVSLSKSGNGTLLSAILGYGVVGPLSACFTIFSKDFFEILSNKNYFEQLAIKKAAEKGISLSEEDLKGSKRFDFLFGRLKIQKWAEIEYAFNLVVYAPLMMWGTLQKNSVLYNLADAAVMTGMGLAEQGVYELGIEKMSQRESDINDLEFLLTGNSDLWKSKARTSETKQRLLALAGSFVNTALKIDKMSLPGVFPKVLLSKVDFLAHFPLVGDILQSFPVELTTGMLGAVGVAAGYYAIQSLLSVPYEKAYPRILNLINFGEVSKEMEDKEKSKNSCSIMAKGA